MISTTWNEAPAGMSAAGLVVRPVVRPRCDRRASEAFTAPYQGTGLPFGASVVDTVAPAVAQRPVAAVIATGTTTDKFHNDATTFGNHSSRRPPG